MKPDWALRTIGLVVLIRLKSQDTDPKGQELGTVNVNIELAERLSDPDDVSKQIMNRVQRKHNYSLSNIYCTFIFFRLALYSKTM